MEHPLPAPDSVGVRYHRGRRYVEVVGKSSLQSSVLCDCWFRLNHDKLFLHDSGVDLVLCDRQNLVGLEKFYVLDSSVSSAGVHP